MNYRQLYSKTVHGLMLLKNKRIKQHVVVFESDDWGSVRMPSLVAKNRLEEKGVKLALPQSYDSVDTLASNDDLELLAETLASVKGGDGRPAKITLNTCVANPDFEKIKASGFNEYFYEPFIETLKRYPRHDRAFELWKEGIRKGVFQPQFHGREHLNPQKWLRYLRSGEMATIASFEEGCFSMNIYHGEIHDSVLPAFDICDANERDFIRQSICEGLNLFEKIFDFRSESMIAPCYIWDDYIEEEAATCGVRCFQGGYIQSHSRWQKKEGNRITGHYMGERNKQGGCYIVRNCSFEPSQIATDKADSCMAAIDKAFRYGLPAVVSCHRLNFIGDLIPDNRDKNLKEFWQLLKMITKHYPDVVFMSSDELGKVVIKA